ncbi:DUF3995 domain-containing protein [Streptomyces rubellomurinus]|uniref:DUF3995 domain-containing protein n=1 Tax=Streptomyces sp. Y1 TaxID=3238634 RepID=A0AB39TQ01_9ACTN|nr:DUF3995 domain-containing protein [Streptomyces rubellomurinus]
MSAVKATGVAVSAAMAAVGVLHAVWAVTPWPVRDPKEFAETMIGEGDEMPPPVACLAVAGMFGTASYLVASEAGVVPAVGPKALRRLGLRTVSGVMLGRGIGGLALFGTVIGRTDRFLRMDRRYYSPLCLALGAGTALVAGRRAGAADRPQ